MSAFKYLSFTGESGCYAELPLDVLPGATTFTIEVELSTTSTKSSSNNWQNGHICGREIPNNWQDDFGLYVNGGKLCFWAEPKSRKGNDYTGVTTSTNTVVNDGNIHRVAVVSSNNAIDLYCDGELVAHTDNVKAKITDTYNILLAYNSDSASYLQMDLYEARFWSVARTQEQIFADIDGTENGLQAWYLPSEDGLLDYSGNSRHATLYGNPVYTELDTLDVSFAADVQRKLKNDAKLVETLAVYLPFDNSATEDLCGNTWTTTGNPTIGEDGAISGKALQLNGSSYLSKSGGISLGGKDFTICGRAKLDTSVAKAWGGLFSFDKNRLRLIRYSTETNKFEIGIKGSVYSITTSIDMTADNFHWEIDYTHSDGKWRVFINGTQVYSQSSTTLSLTTYSTVYIGHNGDTATNDFRYWGGTIDEFQIYDGVALHTANFTPPTANDYLDLKRALGVTVPFEGTFDVVRHIANNVEFSVDARRKLTNAIDFTVDTQRRVVVPTVNFNVDVRRKLTNTIDFTADAQRDVIKAENFTVDLQRRADYALNTFTVDVREFSADVQRTVLKKISFAVDLERTVRNTINVNFSADTQRRISNTVDFAADVERQISNNFSFAADLQRTILMSRTGERMLSRVSPVYDNSTFMKSFFHAIGTEWEKIRRYFLTLREQKFIQTVDWGIEYLEHKYSIVPDRTLTLEERRARLGVKAFNKRPLNPAVLEKYARDYFGLDVYLDESDAGYIWVIATELNQVGYEGFMKFLTQEKPAHLALAFLLYFSEYIGTKDGDDLPKLNVGIAQVTSGTTEVKLSRPKSQCITLHTGITQLIHGKEKIGLPHPKGHLLKFYAGGVLAVSGTILIRSKNTI